MVYKVTEAKMFSEELDREEFEHMDNEKLMRDIRRIERMFKKTPDAQTKIAAYMKALLAREHLERKARIAELMDLGEEHDPS